MKKRVLPLLLALFLCLTPLGGRALAEEATPVEIADAAGLLAMAEDPAGTYRLTRDIDLKGVDWTPFAFSGELDGDGHTLFNLSVTTLGEGTARVVDGNNKVYEAATAGLFSRLEGAKIHNLSLLGAEVAVESESHAFAGALAGWMKDAEIRNVTAVTRVSLRQGGVMSGVGGLIGYGSGELRDCEVTTELLFADLNPKRDCEEFAGGLVGCGHPSILNCRVTWAELWTTVHGYCHNGCLIGMHHVDVGGKVYTTVTGNTVSGRIHYMEDSPSRRAYAEGVIGEKLNPRATVEDNAVLDFDTDEYKELPEGQDFLTPCPDDPGAWTRQVTDPGCDHYGYTDCLCPVCGYTRRESYTPSAHAPGDWVRVTEPTTEAPGREERRCTLCGALLEARELPPHVPGDWETVKEATETESGLRQRRCVDCGAVLAEEALPPHVSGDWETVREPDDSRDGLRVRRCVDCGVILEEQAIPRFIPVRTIVLGEEELVLYYKESFTPGALVLPQNATDPGLAWESGDESVVRVEADGRLRAAGRGETELVCSSLDGNAQARCRVEVRYRWWQWLIVILLFGWLWY